MLDTVTRIVSCGANWLRSFVLLGLLSATGCASIVEGTDQTVTVTTDPTGALCELERDGGVIAVVNPTPGSALIDKSKDDINVRCEKHGYQAAVSPMASSFQGMTFGNILFGGLIGVAIDAGSGAMHEYPAQVVVRLAPEEFPTPLDRDQFFGRRKETLRKEAEVAIGQINRECGDPKVKKDCKSAIEAIEAERDNRIGQLEVQRIKARVSGDP